MSEYNLSYDGRSETLKNHYNSANKDYVLGNLFQKGIMKNIIIAKKSEIILNPFDLENQKFDKITVKLIKV